MFKKVIYEINKGLSRDCAIATLETLQKKFNEMEKDNVPLTYHNLNAMLNQLIEGLKLKDA